MKTKTTYCCGFLFNPGYERVVLIRKNKPAWQAGKLNGVGGKVKKKESAIASMCREFDEETGLIVCDWTEFCVLQGEWGRVYFYYSTHPDIDASRSMTKEQVVITRVSTIRPSAVINNLNWLIPMAASMDQERTASYIVKETHDRLS